MQFTRKNSTILIILKLRNSENQILFYRLPRPPYNQHPQLLLVTLTPVFFLFHCVIHLLNLHSFVHTSRSLYILVSPHQEGQGSWSVVYTDVSQAWNDVWHIVILKKYLLKSRRFLYLCWEK